MVLGNGFGFWNTIPTRARRTTGSTDLALISSPSIFTEPDTRAMSIVSFIRLIVRSTVDLPQPDGPMKAVTDRSGICSPTERTATLLP